jgi:hypothetical protein
LQKKGPVDPSAVGGLDAEKRIPVFHIFLHPKSIFGVSMLLIGQCKGLDVGVHLG